MLIGHFMSGIWERGGIGTYIRRISKAQRAAGHTVCFFDDQPDLGGRGEALEQPNGVRDDADLFAQAKLQKLDVLHLHKVVSLRPPAGVAAIRTVHANNPYCPSGSRYLKRSSRPCDRAYSIAGCVWQHFNERCGTIRPRDMLNEFRLVRQELHTLETIPSIANSQFVKGEMIRSGYLAETIDVLRYPAPEVKQYLPPPKDSTPHFVFLGRITPEKGLEWLLRALAEVRVPIHLDLAGAGTELREREIKQLAQKLGVTDRVTFHGWVGETKALQLLQGARALIFPSVWHEPAGIVSLEAAAAGRAIIASKVGGIPEYAGLLQNAVLVEPNDIPGLARSIEQLAGDWSLAQSMGAQGRDQVQIQFPLEQHLEGLISLYERARRRSGQA